LLMAALEICDWDFSILLSNAQGDSLAGLFTRAARQAVAVVAKKLGKASAPWLFGVVLRPPLLAILARLAPLVVPLDLEKFFAFHFGGKMAEQTLLLIQDYADWGKDFSMNTSEIQQLIAQLKLSRRRSSRLVD